MKQTIKYILGKIFYRLSEVERGCVSSYLTSAVHSGHNSRIGGDCRVRCPSNIWLGDNSYVNGGQLFADDSSSIRIGNDCMISYCVHIRVDTHVYSDFDINMNAQGSQSKRICIGDNVWIGYGAQIMSGVTIGSNVIVGAGAIVTKDVPDNVVVAGVPAKVIHAR